MTKKDYIKAANLIKSVYFSNELEKDRFIETFIKFFNDDNPKFDLERFRKACR